MKRCKKCGLEFEENLCKTCRNAYMREWNKKNKEKVLEGKRKEYQKNKQRYYESYEKWRKENPEANKIIKARYREKNRELLREKGRKYYSEHVEEYREREKENREKVNGYKKAYEERYPEKTESRRVYKLALMKGDLIKPENCTECDSTDNIEGHHEDYSKPLEVIWLCHSCHMKKHRKYV